MNLLRYGCREALGAFLDAVQIGANTWERFVSVELCGHGASVVLRHCARQGSVKTNLLTIARIRKASWDELPAN